MSPRSFNLVGCGRFCVISVVPVLLDDFVDFAGLYRVGILSVACSMGCCGNLAIQLLISSMVDVL